MDIVEGGCVWDGGDRRKKARESCTKGGKGSGSAGWRWDSSSRPCLRMSVVGRIVTHSEVRNAKETMSLSQLPGGAALLPETLQLECCGFGKKTCFLEAFVSKNGKNVGELTSSL